MARSLVFDLDGTLIDSAPDVAGALNRVFEAAGRSALPLETVRDLVGRGARALVADAVDQTGGGNEDDVDILCQRFLEAYRDLPVEQTTVYPGVLCVLGELHRKGALMGICTNKPEITTWPVLKALDLECFFKVVVCGDTLAVRKPDPRHLLHTIESLGGNPGHAVMIGDSKHDVGVARNAGVRVIAVSYGYCGSAPESLGADILIDRFEELLEILPMDTEDAVP